MSEKLSPEVKKKQGCSVSGDNSSSPPEPLKQIESGEGEDSNTNTRDAFSSSGGCARTSGAFSSSGGSGSTRGAEPAIWPSPDYAVQFTTAVLGLTETQQKILRHELYGTSEDTVLVLQLNQNWMPPANGPTANDILDAIATYNMMGNNRRDNKPGCHRWVFHFNDSGHIRECHQHLLANYPDAFAFGPFFANMAVQAGVQAAQLRTEPLAYAVVITKLAVREDDAADYPLFVTD